ncbi:hypothetical protein E2C06_18875 [Dankookia rubra]|uniref:Uncharacterized protein n=1 Tax=Dankookia rubra TaxID=1442381 RepID=A0A4R5QEU6_9PROT|nr:hypothetical protein [Dankookia rubra]TDH61041.1 hypothetical protein E2C06_18875 [Dankookia rubra]
MSLLGPGLAADARRLGGAFGGFLRAVAETARARGAPSVHFLSSEGRWFAATYARIRAASPDAMRIPPARHLPISRQASFLASLETCDPASLAPLLAQYTRASLGAVLASLGVACPAAELSGFGLHAARPWAEQAPRAFACTALMRRVELRRQEQRGLLLRYLAQQGLSAGGEALVADIGWRGSIQDNLSRLLPRARLHGCYFLLLAPFVAAAPDSTRQSFLAPDAATARRLRFGAPLELAVGSPHGSVTGYRAGDAGVTPVEAPPPRQPAAIADHLAGFRAALAEVATGAPSTPDVALRDVLRVLEHPSEALAALYLGCERDESFGTGGSVGSPAPLTLGRLFAALPRRAARHRLGLALADSGWPWALLRRDLPWLLPLLRPALLRLDLRLPGAPRSLTPIPQYMA